MRGSLGLIQAVITIRMKVRRKVKVKREPNTESRIHYSEATQYDRHMKINTRRSMRERIQDNSWDIWGGH